MTEPDAADEIITIEGKAYSRLMAEEMARDIELVNATRPSGWALADNTALIVGSGAALSFAMPLLHDYLVDTADVSDQVRRLVDRHERGSGIPSLPTLVHLELPEGERGELLRILRPSHEAALHKLMAAFNRCHRWKWHNYRVAHILDEIVGRALPEPGYAEELKQLRRNEPHVAEPTLLSKAADFDPRMLEQLGRDIEAANEANSSSWALLRIKPGALALSVESLTVFYIARERGGLTLMGDPDDAAFAGIDRDAIHDEYKYFPGFWVHAEPLEQLVELVGEFAALHRDAIVDLAHRVKTKTQRANEHQPEALAELSALVGRELPIPGYVSSEQVEQLPQPRSRQERSSEPAQRTILTDPLEIMLDQFGAAGLSYTRAQLAAFYTALQTKGFVILSGISGTGKSKIATGFVEMLPTPSPAALPGTNGNGPAPVMVRSYMKRRRRIVIPTRYYELLAPMERGESHQLPVSINGKPGTGRLWFRNHQGREQYLLSLHQVLGAEIDAWREGQPIYLDFVLNPEGDKVAETRITNTPPASEDGAAEPVVATANHLFLAVRPDWRDSTSLLGYYNPLTQTYEWTEFLRFILRAQASFEANDGLAWFVILDEMNLAHVEHYFADLLSVIESGRDVEGWTREPIRLSYPETLDDEAPPAELKLPPNLYLIGTVNMDETTHAFSPKVLDRAFTIELSEVDFLTYQPARGDGEPTLDDGNRQRLLDAFTRFDPESGRRAFARIDKRDIAEIIEHEPDIRWFLDALNKRLEAYRFHFGYRVFDEIAQYLANNRRNRMMDFGSAFDQAVFMKVLPKFSGSRARLRGPLLSLLGWALNPASPESTSEMQLRFAALDLDDEAAVYRFTEDAAFPATARRALQMLITLENDGFVAFG